MARFIHNGGVKNFIHSVIALAGCLTGRRRKHPSDPPPIVLPLNYQPAHCHTRAARGKHQDRHALL